jgi:Ca2+-binding RTX toxin-like protein
MAGEPFRRRIRTPHYAIIHGEGKSMTANRFIAGNALKSALGGTVLGGSIIGSGVAAATPPVITASPAGTIVPGNCGPFSGLPTPAGYVLYDGSGSAVPLGAPGAPYQLPLVNGVIFVGSQFDDYLRGSGVNDVICGLRGRDDIEGGSGDDDIYGGPAGDTLRGEENSDYIVGGPGGDTIYGDGPVASVFDTADILKGGDGADFIYGGAFLDQIDGGSGGNNVDFGDGGAGGAVCTGLETPVNC